jgi:tetratricopeptide (TPR) repeat protein
MKRSQLFQAIAQPIAFMGAVLILAASVEARQPPQQPPTAQGQPQGRGGPPPAPKNLQVLPKDTPAQEVNARMQIIGQSLGVRCEYCHVDEPGPNGRRDMSADEKPTKNTARVMMRLTEEINTKLASGLGKANPVSVGCVTCHRGVPIPKQLPAILTDAAADKGMPAAIAQYRDLRKQYYGGMAYDFSENALIAFANRTAAAKPDDAIQWLELNLEFYPKSARSYLTMAQIYSRNKQDKENAIKNAEKALEIDPENAQAKRMLDQLKSGH